MSRKKPPAPHKDEKPAPIPHFDPWAHESVTDAVRRSAADQGRFDAQEVEERLDAYKNEITGIGDYLRDKTYGGKRGGPDFELRIISGPAATDRWRGSALGARIVEAIPDEMTREGWEIIIQPSEEDATEPADDALEGGAAAVNDPAPPDEAPPTQPAETPAEVAQSDAFPVKAPAQPPPAAGTMPPQLVAHAGMLPPPPPSGPGPLPEIDDEGAQLAEAVEGKLDELGAADAIHQALTFERAYGGGAILMGADDGQENLLEPLDEERIDNINWLNAFQGGPEGEIIAWSYYRDPRSPKYGMPETYMLRNIGVPLTGPPPGAKQPAGQANEAKRQMGDLITWVHESRLLIFPGRAASRQVRQQMRGWGDSIFTRVDEVLSQFGQTWGGIANLMTEFSISVLTLEGLKQALAAGADNPNRRSATQTISTRARALAMGKSIARMTLLHEGETFARHTAQLAGVSEVLQQFAMLLAGVADMPVDLLFSSMNAGALNKGDSVVRFFYDRIAARQKKDVLPQLKRLVCLIMKSKKGPTNGVEPEKWNVKFNPLNRLTELEQAQLRKTVAETDHIYITDQVVNPEEVTASRFGGSEWTMETTIDFDGRAKMVAQEEADKAARAKAMVEAAKNAPPPPTGGAQPADPAKPPAAPSPPPKTE